MTPRRGVDAVRTLQDVSNLDVADVFDQAAGIAADVCGAVWAGVFVVSNDSQVLQCVAAFPERAIAPSAPLAGNSLWSQTVLGRDEMVRAQVDDLPPNDRQLLQGLRVQFLLALPMAINGRRLGALVLGRPSGEPFDEALVQRAERHSRSLAVAVGQAKMYQEATQRIAELSLLHEVGRAFNESLELSEILETCADQLIGLLDATDCFIFLKEAEGLRCVAANGLRREEIPEVFIGFDEPSISALAIRERRAIAVTDALADPRINPRMRDRFSEKSVLAIPMMHRGRAVGCLLFGDVRRKRSFAPAEIERAGLVASHLAVAVDNARLYEDLRRSYSDLADAQTRLVQRERLAALGELAAQVAHEVRNPLGAIFNAVGELRRELGTGSAADFLLQVLREEAERINRIVSDLLDFARPVDLNLSSGGLEALITEVTHSELLGRNIANEYDFGPGLEQVGFDPRLMRQVFLNLVQNAVQAIAGDGRMRVSARVVDQTGRAYCEVMVEDSGPGVDASVSQRIFEPFFTTKPSGIGLGLAVVKRIAEAHQGEAGVKRSRFGGAAFTLRWPVQARGEA